MLELAASAEFAGVNGMTLISERLRHPDRRGPQEARQDTMNDAADVIDALVAALERMTRVARVELGASRPDIFEQADAALALARKGG